MGGATCGVPKLVVETLCTMSGEADGTTLADGTRVVFSKMLGQLVERQTKRKPGLYSKTQGYACRSEKTYTHKMRILGHRTGQEGLRLDPVAY